MMSGVEGIVVLDQTPFYAEMGGQVADHGVITCGDAKFDRCRRAEEQGRQVYALPARSSPAASSSATTVTASIDVERRKSRRAARTPPPICLTRPCKHVLGDHVHQAGSLVEPDRLRFDFTHFEAHHARAARRRSTPS